MQMKCIQVKKVGRFEVTRLPVRPPEEDEALVRVIVTGLCRTDLKLIRVGHRDLVLPRVPGEEVVGEIAEKGVRVTGLERGRGKSVPGQAPDLKSGVEKSRERVHAGYALSKLCEWVRAQPNADKSSIRRFLQNVDRAGLTDKAAGYI